MAGKKSGTQRPSALDSRFGAESMGQVAEAHVFPKNEMRQDIAYLSHPGRSYGRL